MVRIKFRKRMQRKFIEKVIVNSNSPSLRKLIQFGLKLNYQTLKSYYNENRTLPEDIFEELCFIGKIDRKKVRVKFLHENWGQKLGGSR